MFDKIILRLIGSLLIISQFLLLTNAEPVQAFEENCNGYTLTSNISDCGGEELEGEVAKYCIDGYNFYALPTSPQVQGGDPVNAICKVAIPNTPGVYVVKVDGVKSKVITLSTSGIPGDDHLKLAILNCGAESCIRTTGYAKGLYENYYAIYGSNKENKLVSPSTKGCSENNIGGIAKKSLSRRKRSISKPVLCYGINKKFETNGKYVLNIGEDSSSIFDDDPFGLEYNKNYVISVSPNFIILDNLINDEIFSNYETNQVMSKSENICSGNVLNKMYDCKNGICTNMKLPLNGTYLYTTTSKLYTFTDNGKTCTEGANIEGIDTEGVMAFNNKEFDDDPNAFKRLSTVQDFQYITDIENISLKYCKDNLCVDADGFVKYGEDYKNVGRCSDGICSNELVASDNFCVGTNNVGKIKKISIDQSGNLSMEVCYGSYLFDGSIDNNSYIEVNIDETYFISDESINTVNDMKKYYGWKFVSDQTKKAYAFLNIPLTPGYYAVDGNSYTIITKDKEENGNRINGYLLNCDKYDKDSDEISCLIDDTYGYYKNTAETKTDGSGFPYIGCSKGENERCYIIAKPDEQIECIKDTLGTLDKNGELCLGIDNSNLPSNERYQSYSFIQDDNKPYELYLTDYTTNPDSTFYISQQDTSNKYILIKITSNAMIFFSTQSTNQSVCVTYETNTYLAVENSCMSFEYCEMHECKEYGCTAGICTPEVRNKLKCNFGNGSGEDCEDGGTFFVKDNSFEINEHEKQTIRETEGYLFYCPGNHERCQLKEDMGYFVKDDGVQYYACNGKTCKDYSKLAPDCNNIDYVGKLFKNEHINDNKLSICLGIENGTGISAVLKDYSKELSPDNTPIFNPGKYTLANSKTTSYIFDIPKVKANSLKREDTGDEEIIDPTKFGMIDIYADKVIPKIDWRSSVLYVYSNSLTYEIIRKNTLGKFKETCNPLIEFTYTKNSGRGICTIKNKPLKYTV